MPDLNLIKQGEQGYRAIPPAGRAGLAPFCAAK